jgi:hypothetical protein
MTGNVECAVTQLRHIADCAVGASLNWLTVGADESGLIAPHKWAAWAVVATSRNSRQTTPDACFNREVEHPVLVKIVTCIRLDAATLV